LAECFHFLPDFDIREDDPAIHVHELLHEYNTTFHAEIIHQQRGIEINQAFPIEGLHVYNTALVARRTISEMTIQ
jgi:hypothetical protein